MRARRPAALLLAALLAAGSQRGEALRPLGEGRSPQYVALCTIVKDQNADVREWAEHYRALGVARIYLVDSNSSRPVGAALADHIASGFVHYFYSEGLRRVTRFEQLFVYDLCLAKFGPRHDWLLFVDVDEFLVLGAAEMGRPGALPRLLRRYEAWGGLVINWRIFGSSGHSERQEGTLASYTQCAFPPHEPGHCATQCLPEQHELNRHVKTAVRTRGCPQGNPPGVCAMAALTPHHFAYAPGFYPVTEAFARAEGHETPTVGVARVALNHYALKSAAEFRQKVARGNGMGDPKTWEYFTHIDALATAACAPLL